MLNPLNNIISPTSIDLRSPETRHDEVAHSSGLLLFAFEYPPVSGGIARLCAEITNILERNSASASVLTQKCVAPAPPSILPEIRVDSRRPIREWKAFRWLRKHMPKIPTTDHATICGIWYPEGLIAYLAGVRPLVILAHGAELLPPVNRWRRLLWNALQRLVLESANLVIANSEYTRELVSSVAPRAKVEAIPLAVDCDRFAPGDREAAKAKFGLAGKRVLCTVSRIHHYKAHDTVLRAIANLALHEREQLVYLIVGTGPHERELRKLAVELGIESHVRWLGFVSEQELPQVYWASDLFVLCTRDVPEERAVEGFGMVFLEAQACGIPVVGTRTGGIPAAIRDGEGGWSIEQDDSHKLTDLIRQLMQSPESFCAAGIQARQRVLRESTWECYGQRLSSILQSVGIVYDQSEKSGSTSIFNQQKQGMSIVVPTLNRGSHLIDTVRDLLAQAHRPIEILIVDQSKAGDPALLTLISEHPDLISYHKVQFRGLPLARNYGWQKAKYEAIVFVDDDIRCGPSLASEHLRGLSHPNVGMVAGGIDERMSSEETNRAPGQFNSWTATPMRGFGAGGECFAKHVAGGNFSVWRSVLEAAGGFDEALAVGAALYEETELCLRVQRCGFDIYFNGNARLQHLAAGTGGCRVPNLPRYMASLAHNRAILIGRHLQWFQTPVAYFRLFLLFISYAAHYHTLGIFGPGVAGLLNGVKAAKQPPICSRYGTGVPA
jgi:phosphatidyl-myo-inositol dimannoside synthase